MGSPFHSQTLVTLDKSLFSFGLSNRRISAVFSCFDQSLILPVRPYKEARLYSFYLWSHTEDDGGDIDDNTMVLSNDVKIGCSDKDGDGDED